MGLHVAIGLEKKIVLFNNIFNRHEFDLYDQGVIIEPEVPCKGCYKSSYDDLCPAHCMELISVAEVEKNCLTILK
jgi:heptosyltransferase-2